MKYENIKMIGDEETERFLLEISGHKSLIIIGANPSTANEEKSDRTLVMAMKIADKYGYDGLVFLNLYPQRTKDPKELHAESNKPLHERNLEVIKSVIEKTDNPKVLLAYGDLVLFRPYLKSNLHEIVNLFPTTTSWFKMGELTVIGNPRHLSRLSHSTPMTDASDYISKFLK